MNVWQHLIHIYHKLFQKLYSFLRKSSYTISSLSRNRNDQKMSLNTPLSAWGRDASHYICFWRMWTSHGTVQACCSCIQVITWSSTVLPCRWTLPVGRFQHASLPSFSIIIITGRPLYTTVNHLQQSFSGRRRSCLERSATACNIRTVSVHIPQSSSHSAVIVWKLTSSSAAFLDCFVSCWPGSHLGLRSRLDLAPKRLESRLSHHLMTRLGLKFSWLKSATCTMTIVV